MNSLQKCQKSRKLCAVSKLNDVKFIVKCAKEKLFFNCKEAKAFANENDEFVQIITSIYFLFEWANCIKNVCSNAMKNVFDGKRCLQSKKSA